MHPRPPENTHKVPPRHARRAEERPRGAQESPTNVQDTPKKGLTLSKIELGEAQGASGMWLSQHVLSERHQHRISFVFCAVRQTSDMRFVLVFTIQNACRAYFALPIGTHPKTSQNHALEPPKPSPNLLRTLQNRARSAPGRSKNKQAKSVQKVHKIRPRAKKRRPRAKNGPT